MGVAANTFEDFKEKLGFPSSTKPLDPFIVVAGAYYNRNYIPNSDSEPEYQFQVRTALLLWTQFHSGTFFQI